MRSVLNYLYLYDPGKLPVDLDIRNKNKIVNLGSNENPYPLPDSVIKEANKAILDITRYPDPYSRILKKSLEEYTGFSTDNISIGNGASEILDNICKITLDPFDSIIIPIPSYTMYIFLAMLRDSSIKFVNTKEPEFKLSAEEVISTALHKDAKLIFLASPNNPTGKTIPRPDLIKIIENLPKSYIVVDEAYYEFSEKTIADKVLEYDNLIVVRSFSKFFGLAGLRGGYAIANKKIIENLEKAKITFSVNNVLQKVAVKVLEEKEYFNKLKEKIIREKEKLIKEINKIPCFKALNSETNFILAKLPDNISLKEFNDRLLKQGIIIKDITGIPGIENHYIRITIGTPEENRILIEGLKSVCNS